MHPSHIVFGLLATLINIVLLCPSAWAGSDRGLEAEDLLQGYSVARCLFSEGRLVLERDQQYVVLRQGDTLPGNSRVKVIRIAGDSAVLMEARATSGKAEHAGTIPERMIRISMDESGTVVFTLMSAQPPGGDASEVQEWAATMSAHAPSHEPAVSAGGSTGSSNGTGR